MNVYDFDKTIFWPDSSFKFVMYSLGCHPAVVGRTLPRLLWKAMRYKLGLCDIHEFKESLFSFLPQISNREELVASFWEKHIGSVAQWYKDRAKPDDLIISASPLFLIRPAADLLGVSCIASPVDLATAKFTGPNCHGEEKVRQFHKFYPDASIDEFYSDSFRDTPLAMLAHSAFMVKHGTKIVPWPGK